tara:strand:- start:3567 stop:4064 length:498 start_codon:yes stop_codon:yes gene_type:complete
MAYIFQIVLSIVDELNVYFEYPELKKRRAFTASNNNPNICFVYLIQRYSKGILIDFIYLDIEFENRGDKIMTKIFDELERVLLDLKKLNNENITVQIGNFNNQRLMKHFITKRNYQPFRDDTEIMFDVERVDKYIELYYQTFDMNLIDQINELTPHIPNITKKLI